MALSVQDFKTEVHNNWCPGCGDFGILNSIQMTMAQMELEPHRVALFSGIGCSAKTAHYVNVYATHTLHGRVLSFATGAKLANPDLKVIAVGGDGDGLGIGSGHFVNTGRRNVDITYVLFNNGVYGLTKGQASPTLKLGVQTKSLSQPNINSGVNPLMLALSAGYSYIARGYAFDIKHLIEIIKQGIEHKGTSFIDVLQPCPTYNNINTKDWYGGLDRQDDAGKAIPRVYKLENEDYDPIISLEDSEETYNAKVSKFIGKAMEWGDKIPIGVMLKNESTSSYDERLAERVSTYESFPPATRVFHDEQNNPNADLTSFYDELAVS